MFHVFRFLFFIQSIQEDQNSSSSLHLKRRKQLINAKLNDSVAFLSNERTEVTHYFATSNLHSKFMDLVKKSYRHENRYRALKIFHALECLYFIGRFIAVCFDLSNPLIRETNVSYSVVIFLLEIIVSLPLFFSNILYACHLCNIYSISGTDRLQLFHHPRTLLRFSTLTCFACRCYHEHPAGIHLTRLIILFLSLIIRFITFILGSLCATKFNPICVPYTVLSSLTLTVSILMMVTEVFHFHILWRYPPPQELIECTHFSKGLLRFAPENMALEKRKEFFSINEKIRECQCDSTSISHIFLYHSPMITSTIPLAPLIDGKVIVAYYLTTRTDALSIIKEGFPVDEKKLIPEKIYFTRHLIPEVPSGRIDSEVIIYVRLALDHVLQVKTKHEFDFDHRSHRQWSPEVRSLELESKNWIKVKYPRQIENWMVVFQNDSNELISPDGYVGLLCMPSMES